MPLLIYTLLRIALFVAIYLLLAFVGFRGWVLVIGALLIAALLSFILLPRQADAAAGLIRRRIGDRVSSRLDRSITVDDDVEDAATADGPAPPPPPRPLSREERPGRDGNERP